MRKLFLAGTALVACSMFAVANYSGIGESALSCCSDCNCPTDSCVCQDGGPCLCGDVCCLAGCCADGACCVK